MWHLRDYGFLIVSKKVGSIVFLKFFVFCADGDGVFNFLKRR